MSKNIFNLFFDVWNISKQFYKKSYKYLFLITLYLIFLTLLEVALPYVLKLLVDQSQLGGQHYSFHDFFKLSNLYLLAIAYALGWILSEIIQQFNGFTSAVMLRSFDSSLIYKGLENFFNLKYDVQKQQDTGVFNTNLLRGSDAFGQILYTTCFIILPVVLKILGMVWVLSSNVELSYGLYFLIFSVCTLALSLLITFQTKDFFTEMYQARNGLNQFIVEKVNNGYDIKINGAMNYEVAEFRKRITHYIHKSRQSYLKIIVFMMYQVAFVGVFLFIFMVLSVYLFEQKRFTSGDFVLISTYIISLTNPLMMMSQSIIRLRGNFIALRQYYDYFLLAKDQYSQIAPISSPVFYTFKNAQFYLGKTSITQFNFKLEKGKCYVAIGRTGIGKTSFINYLMGLEQIEKGELFYKNIDISHQFSSEIFAEIAFVSQTPIVYSSTLRQNLVHNSRYHYSDAELYDWLRTFQLSELMSKNNIQLDDDLQDIYKSFSGGEKQRISIIRALLKKPQLLILDEPTAALDEKTSLKLMPIIKEQVSTIFMISHANYALDFADEIIDFNQLIAKNIVAESEQK